LERLKTLRRMVIDNRQNFRDSLAKDFGSHHPWLVDLMETGPVIGRVKYIEANLADWMQPRSVDLGVEHGASRGEILHLPKGVMGNISPWNFAIESALVMCADMLAAGNTVIVKPSELAPATSQALADAVSAYFDPDVLAVVQGGPELAAEFASLQWDHLTFTGSARIGKLVAQAAAANLVPVTLELGGKNPALFAEDGVTPELVKLFLSFRALKSGQVCTSPDYVMVAEHQMEQWVAMASEIWRQAYPSYVGHPDCVGIINPAHYARLMGYLDEAQARGVRVVGLNEDKPDAAKRQIPLTLVIDPPADLACMTDEVFGPIIPVTPYTSMDEAIQRINAGPSPLGSYIATHDTALARRFIAEARSGGAAVNNFGLQGGHVALPFGGFGASGQGCHSAREGFLGYSHTKSVFHGASDSMVHKVLEPPLSELSGMAANGLYAAPVEG
jgi:coniferyl-aldehyde dehydrogenase